MRAIGKSVPAARSERVNTWLGFVRTAVPRDKERPEPEEKVVHLHTASAKLPSTNEWICKTVFGLTSLGTFPRRMATVKRMKIELCHGPNLPVGPKMLVTDGDERLAETLEESSVWSRVV